MNQPLTGRDAITKGQDWLIRFRVLAEEEVRLDANAPAGATTLQTTPLQFPLESADKLLFGEETIVTLGAGAPAGSTSLTVVAIPGALPAASKGQKIRDLTGYDLGFSVVREGEDAEALIATDDLEITTADQDGALRGVVDVAGGPSTTASLAPGHYRYSFWSRGAGAARPLARGTFEIVADDFVA